MTAAPVFHVLLYQPEIPPNTGNVIRLAANTGARLHLIEPLGFDIDNRQLKRAGLDYHEYAIVQRHASWAGWWQAAQPAPQRCFAFSTRGQSALASVRWRPGDWLIFGNESTGLSDDLLAPLAPAQRVRLPMRAGQRSLNLSNAVAVAVFEAWRQQGYAGGA